MGLGTTYTWSPTDHQGLHSIRWYEWTSEGVQVSISDWDILPDLPQEQRTEAWWLQD
jgi:hypothetical protein